MRGPKRHLLLAMAKGGWVATLEDLARAARDRIPVVGCRGTRALIDRWAAEGRTWVYRDRGYFRRAQMATNGLPPGNGEGYWRWHIGATQLARVPDGPVDLTRFRALGIKVRPWRKAGGHILVAAPSKTLTAFHRVPEGWVERTVARLRQHTDRPIRVRPKPPPRGYNGPGLVEDLKGAHALVTFASNAAVEAAVLGIPVFVDPVSAAAPIGLTDLSRIETPTTPDRDPWLAALANSQFSADEMRNGAVWRMLQ